MGLVRRWGPWTLLLAVAVAVLAVGLQGSGAKPSLDARVQHIASEVRCPVCHGETVAQSQAAPSVEIRNLIRVDVQKGESDSQILASIVASYGPGILEKPQAKGVDLLVWVLPVVGVVLAAAGLLLAFRRWRAAGATVDAPPAVPGDAPASGGAGAVPADGVPAGVVPAAGASSGGPGAVPADVVPAAGGLTPAGAVASASAVALIGDAAPDGVVADGPVADGPVGDGPAVDRPAAGGPTVSGRRTGRKRTRMLAAVAGATLVAGGAAWAVVAFSGTRLPGEEISGQALGAGEEAAALQAAQKDETNNDVFGAVKEYQKVLNSDPKQVQALAGQGWLLAQTGQPGLLKQGLTLLQSAEQVQPGYAPAHLYRGLALLGEADYVDAVPELQWYLDHSPDPKLAPQVRSALAQAKARAAAEGAGSGPAGQAPGSK